MDRLYCLDIPAENEASSVTMNGGYICLHGEVAHKESWNDVQLQTILAVRLAG